MSINKVSGAVLDATARRMIVTNLYGSKEGIPAIKDFFTLANKAQGRAIVSYYSELNKLKKEVKPDFIEDLPKMIEKRVSYDPELRKLTNNFVNLLKKNYPKTLGDRIALADFGCVVNDRVRPQSFWKKLMVSISHLIREE